MMPSMPFRTLFDRALPIEASLRRVGRIAGPGGPARWMFLSLLLVVAVPAAFAQRWVTLAPSLTESACRLGFCDRLVGVTEYCLFPEDVKNLPRIGGYLDPNVETIVALRPDLVWALPEQTSAIENLRSMKVRVEVVNNHSIEDIYATLTTMGELGGRAEEAKAVLAEMRARQRELRRRRVIPPRVLLVLGHGASPSQITEAYVVGRYGFMHEMIAMAGGVNAYPSEKPAFPKLTREGLLGVDPDVIVVLMPRDDLSAEKRDRVLKKWQSAFHLKAVKNDKVHVIHRADVLQPGPRFLKTLAELVAILDAP